DKPSSKERRLSSRFGRLEKRPLLTGRAILLGHVSTAQRQASGYLQRAAWARHAQRSQYRRRAAPGALGVTRGRCRFSGRQKLHRAVAATLANARTEPALSGVESTGLNVYIFDTAGRQEINEPLIQELKELKEFLDQQETLLVVDAATGQQAVSVATHFNDAL